MEINRKKIFITGASGFLGKHFVIDSKADDFLIYALTRDKNKLLSDQVFADLKILEGDISNIEKFTNEISECNYFIHIAGEKRDESKMKEVNVDGMKKLLKVLKKFPSIKLIYISSGGVYGLNKISENEITEEVICHPQSLYEKTKLEAENILNSENLTNRNIQYLIFRPTNVFGEYDQSYKLLNLMKALKNERFFYIDKNAFVNFVYVKYVTSAMLHFIKAEKFNNETYIINTPFRLFDLIEILKSELMLVNKNLTLPRFLLYPFTFLFNILPEKYKLLSSEKYRAMTNKKIYSIEKLKSEFTADDKSIFISGLKNLVIWYKKNNLI